MNLVTQPSHTPETPAETSEDTDLGAKRKLVAFMANPNAYDYAEVTVSLCGVYTSDTLSDEERVIADEILTQLSKSMEVRVRKALAEHLKESVVLPHDIAFDLANDIETVALPMLEFSEVLTDEDLVKIVRAHGDGHQTAVAGRRSVSEVVSEAIVEQGSEAPIATLMGNEGAEISEESYDNVITLFPESEPVTSAMAGRPDLPSTVAEKLVDLVSDSVRFELITRNATSAPLIDKLLKQGSENATIALLSQYHDINEAEELATQLSKHGRLTPTLLLRALYYGQIDFVEFAMARLAQVHVRDARGQIHNAQPHAFQRFYRRAGLPAQLYLAFTEALVRLAGDIAELPPLNVDSNERRVVASLLSQGSFNRGQFESALLMAGTD